MYNYVHGSLPHSLFDIFTFTRDIHIHETRQTSHIRPFISSTENLRTVCYVMVRSSGIYLNNFILSLKANVVRGYCVLA